MDEGKRAQDQAHRVGEMSTISETLARVSALSVTQHQVLRVLAASAEPMKVDEVARELGLKNSAVRETLTVLVDSGMVTREAQQTHKKGRPSWLYSATVTTDAEQIIGEFASLMAAIADQIATLSPDPGAAAKTLGAKWGENLIAGQSIPDHSKIDADAEVEGKQFLIHAAKIRWFLSRLGFAAKPGTEPTQIEMHQCPLLVENPEQQAVICSMHGAMLSKVVTTLSRDRLDVSLTPFEGDAFCGIDLIPGVKHVSMVEARGPLEENSGPLS